MKKLAFLTALMLIGMNAFSQAVTELRPFWVKQVPQIPVGANYFVNWGVGEGRTETEATNMAWADALQKSLHELGVVGITAQDINAVAMNGINAVVKFNRMKRRIVTSTEPIVLSANRVKIYILIQVQRNVNGPDDFYSLNTANFKDTSFNKKMKGYNAQLTGRYPFSARVFEGITSLLGPRLCARHGTAAQRQYGEGAFFYHKRSRLCRRNRSNGVYACFLRLQDKIHARCRENPQLCRQT